MDELPRIDKKSITVTSLDDITEEKKFWLSKKPLERLEAIEINRRMVYGKVRATARLKKVLEVVKLT